MAIAEQQMPSVLTSDLPARSIHAETDEYRRFIDTLRMIRSQFASNEYGGIEQACETLTELSRTLEQRAVARSGHEAEAEDRDGPSGPGSADDGAQHTHADLRQAQLEARIELMATVQVLADLNAHSCTLVTALRGGLPTTYDQHGRRQGYGG